MTLHVERFSKEILIDIVEQRMNDIVAKDYGSIPDIDDIKDKIPALLLAEITSNSDYDWTRTHDGNEYYFTEDEYRHSVLEDLRKINAVITAKNYFRSALKPLLNRFDTDPDTNNAATALMSDIYLFFSDIDFFFSSKVRDALQALPVNYRYINSPNEESKKKEITRAINFITGGPGIPPANIEQENAIKELVTNFQTIGIIGESNGNQDEGFYNVIHNIKVSGSPVWKNSENENLRNNQRLYNIIIVNMNYSDNQEENILGTFRAISPTNTDEVAITHTQSDDPWEFTQNSVSPGIREIIIKWKKDYEPPTRSTITLIARNRLGPNMMKLRVRSSNN